MGIKPVPTWRKWWKRYSTYLSLSLPALTIAREALPNLQEVIPLAEYKLIIGLLGFLIVIAVNIKQNAVSGGPTDEPDKTQ